MLLVEDTGRLGAAVTWRRIFSGRLKGEKETSRKTIQLGYVLIIRLMSSSLTCDVWIWYIGCRCWIDNWTMNDLIGEIFRHSLMNLFQQGIDRRRRTSVPRLTRADRNCWDCSSRRIIRIRRAGVYCPNIAWISFSTDSTWTQKLTRYSWGISFALLVGSIYQWCWYRRDRALSSLEYTAFGNPRRISECPEWKHTIESSSFMESIYMEGLD